MIAFAVVATLASVAGGWVVSANQYGRIAALALLLSGAQDWLNSTPSRR